MSKKKKGVIAINLEYIAARFGISLIRSLPLSVAFSFTSTCCKIFFNLDAKHRKRSISHILHAGITNDPKVARKLAMDNFVHFGKVAVEFVKLDQFLSPETVKKHVKYNITPEQKAALLDPKGTICASAHYGNWEITGLSLSLLFRPIVSIGRKFDNPKLSKYIFSKRHSFKQEIHTKEGAVKHLLKGLKQKKIIGLLVDQHAGGSAGIVTTFFGHPAKTHDSPGLLYLKTGAPVLLVVSRRLNNKFNFELIVRGPFTIEKSGDKQKDLKAITQNIVTSFEEIVKECPEQWLWSHRRWMDINRKGWVPPDAQEKEV